MEVLCADCGRKLDHIRYVRPDWHGLYSRAQRRDPLCRQCWEKADHTAAIAAVEEVRVTTQADYNGVYVSRYASREGMRLESRNQEGSLLLDVTWAEFQDLIKAGQELLQKAQRKDQGLAAMTLVEGE